MKNTQELTEVRLIAPSIPTGTARTRGYGTTVEVYVIRCTPDYRTRNSPHKVLRYFGRCRTDYGLIRGYSAKVFAEARAYSQMVADPEPRTTREEF